LVQATPNSQVPAIATFRSFREYHLDVPRTFVQILDLLGKTDFGDWIIRVKHNQDLIQRLLLKGIVYSGRNGDYTDEFIYFDDDDRNKLKNLENITFENYDSIYFPTTDSVDAIKTKIGKWIDMKLRRNFAITLGSKEVMFSYPQLPNESPSKQEVLAWLNMFDKDFHEDYSQIICTGCLYLVNLNWLNNASKPMKDIDSDFVTSPVAERTPIELLNASGLHHIDEFLSKKHFIELARSGYTYYNTTITQRLKSIFVLVPQGISTVGSPAQLVFVPKDQIIKRDQHTQLPRHDINPNLNHCLSYVKLEISDKVIKSAMIRLVEDVDLDPDYEGHFSSALSSIRRAFLNLDGLTYSQSRQYG